MKKLESLTDEQIAMLPGIAREWIDIGLSTKPARRGDAETAIADMYRRAGLPTPRIVWCASPMSQGITRSIVMDLDSFRASVGDSVGDSVMDSVGDSVMDSVMDSVRASVMNSVRTSVMDSVWASVWASVGDSVRASVGDSVWDSVGDSVRASVRDSVGDSVRASVRASVRDSVGASVGASIRDSVGASVGASVRDSVMDSVWDSVGASVMDSVGASVGDSVYGQHDADWLAFYDALRMFGIVDETSRLSGLWQLARSAGWALPHQKICWISERPNRLLLDGMGRLHCETGSSLSYPDGWEIFAWHGVRVPGKWITSKTSLTPSIALTWTNVEQRRAACEIVGWHRILSELTSRTINKHKDPQVGELIEVDLPDSGKERFLRVQCGTGREFALPVPGSCHTALSAQAWTWGLSAKEFKQPEVRT